MSQTYAIRRVVRSRGGIVGSAGFPAGPLPSLLCCSPVVPTVLGFVGLSGTSLSRVSGNTQYFFATRENLILTLGAVGLIAITRSSQTSRNQRLTVGATAPDAPFTTTNGQATTITALRGRPALVWFVTTFCGSCEAGTQAMAAHIKEFGQHRVKVVELELANNLGGTGPDIATFGKELAGKQCTPRLDLGHRLPDDDYDLRPHELPRHLLPHRRPRSHRLRRQQSRQHNECVAQPGQTRRFLTQTDRVELPAGHEREPFCD
jgi:thiol-disulfide isomerase/thioredoxin